MTRDISPAAKYVSSNTTEMAWLLSYSLRPGSSQGKPESEEKKSLLGQLSNSSPGFKHEDVQNEFFSKGKDC